MQHKAAENQILGLIPRQREPISGAATDGTNIGTEYIFIVEQVDDQAAAEVVLPKRNPSQAVCIRVHPGRYNLDLPNIDRKRYYTLAIFENGATYVKWLTSVGVPFDPEEDKRYGYSGACTLYDRDYNTNRLGFICLRMDTLDTEIVAHESVHAALGFVYRTASLAKFQFGRDDELLAYPVGVIANQIVIGLNNYHMQQAQARKKRK